VSSDRTLQSGIRQIVEKLKGLGVEPPESCEMTLARYAEILMNSKVGLVSRGDRTPLRVVEHIEDCAAVFEVCGEIRRAPLIGDLGSGNGLPGIVVASLLGGEQDLRRSKTRPRVVLMERSRRLAAFLRRVCLEVGVSAEVKLVKEGSRPTTGGFRVLLMRAVTTLPAAPSLAAPYLDSRGTAVVWAGRPSEASRSACADACRAAGLVGKWTRSVGLRSRGEFLVMKVARER
jgi:16S rRNA G527 N7-methylase RsmG